MSGLEEVFVAHRAAIVRFLRARGAGDEADDLAQDLWLRLRSAATGPIGEPLPYLYRMADNMMIDRHRSRIRRQRREESWTESIGSGTEMSDEPAPDRRIAAQQRLSTIRERLAALGTRTEQIFFRFRVDGVGQCQIATEQGVSVSAVEKHLQKAYRTLLSLDDDAVPDRARRLDPEGMCDEDG